MNSRALTAAASLLALATASPALAQTPAAPPAESAANQPAPDEPAIIVTAQLREQRQIDVPFAVTAYTGKFLEQKGKVVRVGARAGRARDQFFVGFLEFVDGFVRQVRADGKHHAVRAGGAEPLKLEHVEADLLDFGELRNGDVGIGGKDGQTIRLGDVENIVGRQEMSGAGHVL